MFKVGDRVRSFSLVGNRTFTVVRTYEYPCGDQLIEMHQENTMGRTIFLGGIVRDVMCNCPDHHLCRESGHWFTTGLFELDTSLSQEDYLKALENL